MRSALLRGSDHHELGSVALVAEGPVAIALSKGGAAKTYAHTDPNEDAALFAAGAGGSLIAVADGHDGASGSQAALEALLDRCAAQWTATRAPGLSPEHWPEVALESLSALNAAVLREAAERTSPPAPTTLSLALVRPDDDLLLYASIGDSHVFRCADDVADLGWSSLGQRRTYFLGYASERAEALRNKSVVGSAPLTGTRALVLATDGISERGIGFEDPARAVHEALRLAADQHDPGLRPAELGRGLTEAAVRAQRRNRAGDNIASAVVWLGD